MINDRAELKKILINQNKKYNRKVFQIKAYKDQIYSKLLNDNMRDRILQGMLIRKEYTESNILSS